MRDARSIAPDCCCSRTLVFVRLFAFLRPSHRCPLLRAAHGSLPLLHADAWCRSPFPTSSSPCRRLCVRLRRRLSGSLSHLLPLLHALLHHRQSLEMSRRLQQFVAETAVVDRPALAKYPARAESNHHHSHSSDAPSSR